MKTKCYYQLKWIEGFCWKNKDVKKIIQYLKITSWDMHFWLISCINIKNNYHRDEDDDDLVYLLLLGGGERALLGGGDLRRGGDRRLNLPGGGGGDLPQRLLGGGDLPLLFITLGRRTGAHVTSWPSICPEKSILIISFS